MRKEDRLCIIGEERNLKVKTFMDYQNHITRDPAICGGEAVIKGTRVTIRTILASLAEGDTASEILADFPSLTEQDVRAVIAFAAAAAEDDLPVPAAPAV